MSDIVYISVNELQNFMKDVFIHLGVPADEAALCSEVLIKSDLRGIESHGIGRLKMYYDRIRNGQHKAITNIEIVKESPTTAIRNSFPPFWVEYSLRLLNPDEFT